MRASRLLNELEVERRQRGVHGKDGGVEPRPRIAEVAGGDAAGRRVAEPERLQHEGADGARPQHVGGVAILGEELRCLGEELHESDPRAEAAEGVVVEHVEGTPGIFSKLVHPGEVAGIRHHTAEEVMV